VGAEKLKSRQNIALINMRKILGTLFFLLVILVTGCKKDEPSPEYTIVNNGNAGVSSLTDTEDGSALEVVQAVPSVSGETYPVNIPIMFFLNDKIYLNSITDNFTVTVNGKVVGGTIYVNEASNGYAILIFTPADEFGVGKEIMITLKTGIQDDGGNGFTEDFVFTFTTESSAAGNFDENKSFESGNTGVTFVGDGAILSGAHGSVSPQDGSKFCAITSGSQLVSSGNAVGDASSMVILGPINSNITSFSFKYDFISSEFNDYVGSIYDDCAVITAVGPNGAYSESITSVNTVGTANTQCVNFADLPDAGDDYAGHTGWKNSTLTLSNVGTPAYVIFTVTDVSDHIYSSALALDNFTY
jgi:hypothetical protein